jgi:hypothetical protein
MTTRDSDASRTQASRPGKARTAILLWLLGIPIPLIILFFVVKSCMA